MSNNKRETEAISGPSKEAEASRGDRQAPEAVASQTAPETTSGHEAEAIATSPTKSGSNKKTREIISVLYLRKLLAYNYEQVAPLSFLPG